MPMQIDKELWLQAHMQAKGKLELAKTYGSSDHFDLYCVIAGVVLLIAARVYL